MDQRSAGRQQDRNEDFQPHGVPSARVSDFSEMVMSGIVPALLAPVKFMPAGRSNPSAPTRAERTHEQPSEPV